MPVPATAVPSPALLFCPGDRPDRFAKALAAADGLVIDLEDAVSASAKNAARAAVCDAVGELDPARVIVRINAPGSPWIDGDLEALAATPLRTLMVPKVDAPATLAAVDASSMVAMCESAAGVLAAASIAAHPNCVALAFGGQDLALSLQSDPLDGDGRLHATGTWARHTVRFAAAAAGIDAIDTARLDLEDEEGLATESRGAASAGFHAKLAIHPRQVPTIRDAFRPSADEVAHAHRVLRAARLAEDDGRSVVVLDGELIDSPVVSRARRVVRWVE